MTRMHFICYLTILSAVAAVDLPKNYRITRSPNEYFVEKQSQLQNAIYISGLKFDSAGARGADHIRDLRVQHQVVLKEIESVNQNLLAEEALDEYRKLCIQKNKPLLVPWKTAQKPLDICLVTAQREVQLFSSDRYWLNKAKTAANTDLPKAIATCNTTYANDAIKLEKCVLSNVDTYSKLVNENLQKLDRDLETEKDVLKTMGMVLSLINGCLKEITIGIHGFEMENSLKISPVETPAQICLN